ncbi:MAG: hypothetical protein PHS41_06740 [Victivallaceae bacterium]|nr:hypothetical protein [Victivallaceae bacterium]
MLEKKNQINSSLRRDLRREFLALLSQAGSQMELARRTNIDQARIARILSGKIRFENLTVDTVERLLPNYTLCPKKPHPDLRAKIDSCIDALDEAALTELLLHLAARYPEKLLK